MKFKQLCFEFFIWQLFKFHKNWQDLAVNQIWVLPWAEDWSSFQCTARLQIINCPLRKGSYQYHIVEIWRKNNYEKLRCKHRSLYSTGTEARAQYSWGGEQNFFSDEKDINSLSKKFNNTIWFNFTGTRTQ